MGFEHYEQGVSPDWHRQNLIANHIKEADRLRQKDIFHAVIIAVSIESSEVVEPTIKSILNCNYDMNRIILILAFEERCGAQQEVMVNALVEEYGHHFYHMEAIKHPGDIPDEMIGKGANLAFAGPKIKTYLESKNII